MRLIATVTLRSMRAIISYPAPHRLQGLCWRPKENDIRLAVTTFIAGQYENKIQVRPALLRRHYVVTIV